MKGKSVVVTGGNGFLGLALVQELVAIGARVIVIDLQENCKCRFDDVEYHQKNLLKDDLNEVFKGIDFVYHFAAIAGLRDCIDRPIAAAEVNIIASMRVAEACINNGVRKLIFGSSLYVFSKEGSFYRSTKQSIELLIESYSEEYGLKYTFLRFGSLYGPNANDFNFIHNSITAAIKNKKIIRNGSGEELREYIHVTDASLLAIKAANDEYDNLAVLISGREKISVKRLLDIIREILNNDTEVIYTDMSSKGHYYSTPYSYIPKKSRKIELDSYIDLGEGLLNLIQRIDFHDKSL